MSETQIILLLFSRSMYKVSTLREFKRRFYENGDTGAGEVTQLLRALTALADD